ncbi:MAG TPA: maleylpyruvate isomerase family mycothiol-dependent enzyme [Flexivirga sp.]|uniref:maleylpyruvate isomerase family mycothiol-dependent enzyme n=1 Tax=Flexivirga sp. TaxID=1962927 RepID=UPI002C6DCAEF|nr:maleylpyruvate isomerase family mycothiol-dependent enzyme [Flexivirga sp.]HWC24656.1 maleylpyruvate isomerase family mycothiol-dependent enzyme [Flexivirga sp.]
MREGKPRVSCRKSLVSPYGTQYVTYASFPQPLGSTDPIALAAKGIRFRRGRRRGNIERLVAVGIVMTDLAIRTIEALRQEHDALVDVAHDLTDDRLSGPSGASEWSVAQVFSHLGSGGEITLASLNAALGEGEAPDGDFNRAVWARWDAMAPAEQRAGFLEHDRRLVEKLESLTPEQVESLTMPIGFLPAPATAATFAGLRLNEVANHSWDVRVAIDSAAGLREASATALFEQLSGDLGVLVGFAGKAESIDERVVLAVGDTGYSVVIDDGVSLQSEVDGATATFAGAPEAALRLIFGRLGSAYTPDDVTVTGNVTLDQLREVFPGF